MNYNAALCSICNRAMTFGQLRNGVYWLPDMDRQEYIWAKWDGFEHQVAHLGCWRSLKAKKRELIKLLSFKGHEPRSLGALV